MVLVDSSPSTDATSASTQPWPAEVDFILSALDAANQAPLDRRGSRRHTYHVPATLTLYSDSEGSTPWTLYSRDVTPRSLGFITRHRLPLGYGGTVQLPGPDGQILTLPCMVLRCREAANGWFEGAVQFNRPQSAFDPLE